MVAFQRKLQPFATEERTRPAVCDRATQPSNRLRPSNATVQPFATEQPTAQPDPSGFPSPRTHPADATASAARASLLGRKWSRFSGNSSHSRPSNAPVQPFATKQRTPAPRTPTGPPPRTHPADATVAGARATLLGRKWLSFNENSSHLRPSNAPVQPFTTEQRTPAPRTPPRSRRHAPVRRMPRHPPPARPSLVENGRVSAETPAVSDRATTVDTGGATRAPVPAGRTKKHPRRSFECRTAIRSPSQTSSRKTYSSAESSKSDAFSSRGAKI
jgi:hypothetical protein